jgi:hypothetical protein
MKRTLTQKERQGVLANQIERESVDISLSLLKPDPDNPRKRDKRSIREIAKSIQNFGFVQPIVVDENYNIIIGHGRFAAAKYLKFTTVPVIVIKNLTERQQKKLQIADNRLSEFSSWNERLLSEQLEELIRYEPLDIPGFDMEEIEKMMGISDYQKAINEHPPLHEELPSFGEYHLLVSCSKTNFDKMIQLKKTLQQENWCLLEEGSR